MDYRFGIGTANEFEISYYHLHYNDKPDWGFAWFNSRPAPGPTEQVLVRPEHRLPERQGRRGHLEPHPPLGRRQQPEDHVRDGYYSRTLRATQASFAAGTTLANLNANTVVSRGNTSAGNAKAGNEHHTFLQTDYLTTTQWFGRKNSLLIGAEYAVENSDRLSYPLLNVAKAEYHRGQSRSAPASAATYTQALETRSRPPRWACMHRTRLTSPLTGSWSGACAWTTSRPTTTARVARPNNTPLSRSDTC
jgi:catecholate siderophore receptor